MDLNQNLDQDQLTDLLRRHGIHVTGPRLDIAGVLFSRMEHVSADQILAALRDGEGEASKATVYNTLRLFVEKGLVREVIVDPARVFFDPNTRPHHHLYDTVTGHLTDIPAESVQILGLPPLPEGMVAEGVDVVIRTRPAPGRRG